MGARAPGISHWISVGTRLQAAAWHGRDGGTEGSQTRHGGARGFQNETRNTDASARASRPVGRAERGRPPLRRRIVRLGKSPLHGFGGRRGGHEHRVASRWMMRRPQRGASSPPAPFPMMPEAATGHGKNSQGRGRWAVADAGSATSAGMPSWYFCGLRRGLPIGQRHLLVLRR